LFLQCERLLMAHSCPERMRRLVRSRRKLTLIPSAFVGQPIETCLRVAGFPIAPAGFGQHGLAAWAPKAVLNE
jgi:hypothetical protein